MSQLCAILVEFYPEKGRTGVICVCFISFDVFLARCNDLFKHIMYRNVPIKIASSIEAG